MDLNGCKKNHREVRLTSQGSWFWIENKITENQWKIAENICTHILKGPFETWSDNVLQLLGMKIRGK